MIKKYPTILSLLMLLTTLKALGEDLRSGPWRFELKSPNAVVPFLAELEVNKGKVSGKIYNGKEIIPLENIVYTTGKLRIPIQAYEITLELAQESPTTLRGFWIRHNKNPKQEIPIVGTYGVTERFSGTKEEPKVELQGKWAIELIDQDGLKSQGVAVFEQNNGRLNGSILTPTGDYRYMEGHVSGDEFEAASFDGMFNYLFKGKVSDGKLTAFILSTSVTRVKGKRDDKAQLPDAYSATRLEAPLKFSFPDLQGKKVSLIDTQFKNKPVILQFFGSWCPNCIDEMNYLIPWYKENKKRGLEIVALSFERSLTESDAKLQLRKVQKKYKVPYPLLVAGTTANDKPMEKIEGLKNFISFPTVVFLNKKHEVIKVHAGFTGPGTGEFFETWKQEFNQTVNELLK